MKRSEAICFSIWNSDRKSWKSPIELLSLAALFLVFQFELWQRRAEFLKNFSLEFRSEKQMASIEQIKIKIKICFNSKDLPSWTDVISCKVKISLLVLVIFNWSSKDILAAPISLWYLWISWLTWSNKCCCTSCLSILVKALHKSSIEINKSLK